MSMFETLEADIENHCHHCRWFDTKLCPYSFEFEGNRMFDTEKAYSRHREICHRFILRNDIREERHQALMDKMSVNLEIDDDDNGVQIPF